MHCTNLLTTIIKKLPIACYPYKQYMHKYKCIFIHIPKNAGSSVGLLFKDDGSRKHAKWYDFRRSNAAFFQEYHKFCIVREPLERLYSAYNYCSLGGNQSQEDRTLMEYINEYSEDFDGFVKNVLNADFIMLQHLFMPQYLYIFDQNLHCQIDTILRYESLAEQWFSFAQKLKLPTELPHINIGSSKRMTKTGIKAILTKESIDKVNKLYAQDFTLLGYPVLS